MLFPEEQMTLCREGEAFEEEPSRDDFCLMFLLYLLKAKGGQPANNWIGEKDLKGAR